jgi:hypothetical protein
MNSNDPACLVNAASLTNTWLNLPGSTTTAATTDLVQSATAMDKAQSGAERCSGALAMNSAACAGSTGASIAATTSTQNTTASLAVSMSTQAGNIGMAQNLAASQSRMFDPAAAPNGAQMLAGPGSTGNSMSARWTQLESSGLVPGLDALSQMTSPSGAMEARQADATASPLFGGPALSSNPAAAVATWGVGAQGGDALIGGNNAASGIVAEHGATLGDLLADNPALAAVLQNPMYTATPDPLADRGGVQEINSNDPWMQALNNTIQSAGNPTSHASTPSPNDDTAGAASDRGSSTPGASSTGGVGRPSGVDFTSPDWE